MYWLPLLLVTAQAGAQTGAAAPAGAQDRAVRMEEIAAKHRAHWGLFAQRIDTGEILVDRCSTCFFTPASITKLITTALALTRLGPTHRFTTEVRSAGEHLYLIGSGDPTLSGRLYPYSPGNGQGAALTPIETLAATVAARGVTNVTGDIIGDDTLWPWRPAPDGWSHDDFTWDFGAPVSALTLADSNIALTILPGARLGDPARLTLNPPVEYFTIDNRIETTPNGQRKLRIERMPGSRQLLLSGTIPLADRGRTETLAIDDPALFAATAFREALLRQGIAVHGVARALHRAQGDAVRSPGGELLATRTSPPLAQIAQVVNKVSQNLHAELLLEASGGLDVMSAFLETIVNTPKSEFRFVDGSGLSRLDTITPRSMVRLLIHMGPNLDFAATLPIGATDGSLQHRYRAKGMEGVRVQAKTGGMTGVQTLAGYVDSRSNGRIAFAMLVNNDNGPGVVTREAMDRIVAILME